MQQQFSVRAAGLFRYFTRHGTAANLVLVLMVVAGLVAIPNMRAQFFPDVVRQSISVSVSWNGAGAEDVDGAIVEVLEPALLAVDGVEGSTAQSREGRATISLEFESDYDMAQAADDVQAAIDAAGNLPDDADDPVIRRSGWADRVTDVVITGPVSVDQLGRFADEYVTRLFAEGVTRTTISGVAAPETVVRVTSASLVRHDISMADIAAAIGAETRADPAGDVSGGTARVRTGAPRRSAEEIAAIVLRTGPDGSSLTIGDVAEVEVAGIDRNDAFFVGDNPAVAIRVDRSAQGDAIGIQRIAERVAEDMSLTLPAGVGVELIRTRAEVISGRLQILLSNGALGLALVVGLLFLFLNARTAFWVAAGIPVAMLAAVAAMYAIGLTFNMMSLFALIITLGLVVDDAIVVGEHADWRARELGEAPAEAAERAATRMALPVFAASITTVIAFLALVAIGGRFGSLIVDIPLTVIAVLLASLVECFVILPHHMKGALVSANHERWYDWPSRQVNRGFRWMRETVFRPFMWLVIRARYPVLAGAILLLAMQGAQFLRGDVQWRFFSSPEQGSITANFAMLPGATRADTMEMMRELQRATDAVAARLEAEHGRNPVDYALAQIGGNAGRALAGTESTDPALLGSIAIDLIDLDLRPYSSFQFVATLQDEVIGHPQLETLSFRSWGSGPGGDSLSVRFHGADTETLKAAAEALKSALMPVPEVSGLEDSLAYDKEELSLTLTPQGQALGFTIDGLGRVLRHRLNGIEAASFPDGSRTARIRVELPENELTADFLDRTLLRSASGQYVPLADIVSVESRTGFSTIRRENGLRVVSVTGDISEDDPARASEINQELRNTILPRIAEDYGVSWELSGLAEQEREFLSDALMGFILCLVGIYLTLAWIFSSWTRPLLVMAVIPFGLIGAVYGHASWGMAFSIFSVVGLVGMAGIIINDSIVLVTTVDEFGGDRGLFPAIVDAACNRLRPVLLTTLTTVLGLTPLLYEGSSQAEFLKPTVITLVYGLGFGMVLVLLMVPAMLAMQFDLWRLGQALRRALGARRVARAHSVVVWLALGGMAALMAATLLPAIWRGGILAPLAGLVEGLFPPRAAAVLIDGVPGAVAVFLMGALALALTAYLVGGLMLLAGSRAKPGKGSQPG
ncbi:efflux RND transporter permease subunit [Alkalilacustris brevis]|uniref:efflux RND transporter permease subunit n=1 Tax=Alkalilacustris brevis TaxID=2026338 RepID=UPI000E0D0A73